MPTSRRSLPLRTGLHLLALDSRLRGSDMSEGLGVPAHSPNAVLFNGVGLKRSQFDSFGCCTEDSLALSCTLVRLITTEAWSARR
jgi:hypothetical protein